MGIRGFFSGLDEQDKLARLAGLLYLITIPTTGAWYGISAALFESGASFASLQAGRNMLEIAIVLGTIGHIDHLVLAVVLYRLLRSYGAIAAGLAATLLAASVPLSFAAVARQMELLSLLGGDPTFAALGSTWLEAQVKLTVSGYMSLFNTQAVFWGLWLLPLGWLLLQSRLVPRALAVCVLLGGPFYLFGALGPVLDPAYASSAFGRVFGLATGVPEVIGEVGTALCLLLLGTRRIAAPAQVMRSRHGTAAIAG